MNTTNNKLITKFKIAVYSEYDKTINIVTPVQDAIEQAEVTSRYLSSGELIKDGEIRLLEGGHSILLTGTCVKVKYTEKRIYRDEAEENRVSDDNVWQWSRPGFFKRMFGKDEERQFLQGWYMTDQTEKINLILSNYYIIL